MTENGNPIELLRGKDWETSILVLISHTQSNLSRGPSSVVFEWHHWMDYELRQAVTSRLGAYSLLIPIELSSIA
jgi:hypothetical protein